MEISLGAVVIDDLIIAYFGSYAISLIQSGVSAKAALEQAEAKHKIIQKIRDDQLTALAMQLAEAFPKLQYWEWMRMLERLREWGYIPDPTEPGPPQPPISPPPYAGQPKTDNTYLYVIMAVLGAFILMEVL